MIRIATWNVEHGVRPDRLAHALGAHTALRDADLILVQEIEHHRAEAEERAAVLARDLGKLFAYAPARSIRAGSHGLAILSAQPLTDVVRIALPAVGVGPFVCDRAAIAATTVLGGHPLRVVNVHLDTRLNAAERIAQVAPAFADASRASVAVAGGDFNTAPFRFLRNNLPIGRADQATALDDAAAAHELHNATAQLGTTTRRRHFFPWRLDAIYTRGLTVDDAGIARDIRLTDHVPIWIDVRWPPTEAAPHA